MNLKEKDFGEGPWLQNNLDNGAGLLIPVPLPLGGAIIIGEQTIVYYNGSVFKAIPIRPVLKFSFILVSLFFEAPPVETTRI